MGQTSAIKTYSGRDGGSAKEKTEAGGWRAEAGVGNRPRVRKGSQKLR